MSFLLYTYTYVILFLLCSHNFLVLLNFCYQICLLKWNICNWGLYFKSNNISFIVFDVRIKHYFHLNVSLTSHSSLEYNEVNLVSWRKFDTSSQSSLQFYKQKKTDAVNLFYSKHKKSFSVSIQAQKSTFCNIKVMLKRNKQV